MNICHVITRLIIGGAQENTVLTCRGLHDRGHKVTLIAGPETGPEGSLWGQAEAIGCELVRLDSMRRAVNPINDLKCLADLRRIYAKLNPEIIHTHSSKAGIIGRFAADRAPDARVIHTIHGMSFNRTQSWPVRTAYRLLERHAADSTETIVTVADAMIEQSLVAGVGRREQFVTIRSGMITDDFRADAETREQVRRVWGIKDGEIVVGTVARLFENKGYDELIRAMPESIRRVPNLRFVWVGDGKHRDKYMGQLRELGIDHRAVLTGLVSPTEIPRCLNGFDLLVHASRWEGLARVLPQALLTEVPVVSFDNDGAPEVVLDGETGFLVPYGDIPRLSDSIVRLATDAELRRRLGASGRVRCLAAFDWRRMVDHLEKLYEGTALSNNED